MLDALRFVRGAIAAKDFVPVLRHFYIGGGIIRGSNGKMTICSPIEGVPDCCPEGLSFIKAISSCESEPSLTLTKAGRVKISAGAFTAFVAAIPVEQHLHVEPEGSRVAMAPGLLDAIKAMRSFVGTDASRQWSTGILLTGTHAYATNNVIAVEHVLATTMPRACLPAFALDELLRINEDPIAYSSSANNLTFYFTGDRWVKTQLLPSDWPPIDEMLNATISATTPPHPDLFKALQLLRPFADEMLGVTLDENGLRVGDAEDAARFAIAGGLPPGFFHLDMLMLLKDSTAIELSEYPSRVPFNRPRLRGIMMGMRRD